MAYLGQEFDASQVEPSKPRDVIPPGEYTAIVEASDVKSTKKALEDIQYGGPAANDKLLELTLKIVDGEFSGSLIWERLNIINSNPTAQEIAQRDLSALCHAVGKLKVKDSSELHNKPIRIKVDVERKEGYNPRNVIKGYSPVSGATPASASAAAPRPPPARPGARSNVALIPEAGDPTLAAIDREMERRAALEPRRSYLGASAIGEPCERKLWYSIRPEVPRKPFDAASLKRFEDGHRGEAVMAERLRTAPGVRLWTEDDTSGGQIGGMLFDGRFGWHVDGVILGLLQSPETPHVWEHKQVGQKKFDEFRKLKGSLGEKATLQAWDPVYYAQGVLYMELLDLRRHYLTVCTPGGREYDSCRTEANPVMAKALLAKAERILSAAEPPIRLSERPEFFKCKWCDFKEVCHVG